MLAIAIGAGAVTVAVAQSLAAVEDNKISPDEQRLMMVVLITMRMALLLLFATHAFFTAKLYMVFSSDLNYFLPFMNQQSVLWTLIAVLFITFVFIDKAIISRQIGVAAMVPTWYALIFITAWPETVSVQVDNFVFAFTIFAVLAVFIIQRSHLYTVRTQAIPRKKSLNK